MTGVTEFPARVRIVEVGPRDGLQNEPVTIALADKVTFIERLRAAGLQDIEVTSFVHPKRVPQLADADELLGRLPRTDAVRYSALVPNMRGLERAIEAGVSRIGVLTAASDTFNRRNINMNTRESITALDPLVRCALEEGISVRGYVSTSWICPYEGPIDEHKVAGIVQELFALGVDEVSVGDTIGGAVPAQVEATLNRLFGVCPRERLAMHFHDTYGMAVANTYQALRMGISTFDSAAGGLGGCPYAPGASGNVATEELLYLFDRLGIETGVRLSGIRHASDFIGRVLGRTLPSRVLATGAGTDA